MSIVNSVKMRLRDTALFPILHRIHEDRELVRWVRNGRPLPPPHIIKRQAIAKLAEQHGIALLVETGTYLGQMVDAMKDRFHKVYTIEIDDALYARAVKRFAAATNVHVLHGDSGKELGKLIPELDEAALFWLDGHYSGGITSMAESETPIVAELHHVAASPVQGHVVLIDDARCFDGTEGYPSITFIEEWVGKNMPDHHLTVSDDLIRITPRNTA